jgi:hypothetical protein
MVMQTLVKDKFLVVSSKKWPSYYKSLEEFYADIPGDNVEALSAGHARFSEPGHTIFCEIMCRI